VTTKSGIREACDIVGGEQLLASALGISQQAVSRWVLKGFAPLDRVPAIAALTGIERKRLCDPRVLAAVDP
jgi:DNA-binding transcriptional regulator YdaS (Cro superfamily)